MSYAIRTIVFLLMVMPIVSLFGQEDLGPKDAAFYQEKSRFYQQWLRRSGLGTYLRVREVGQEGSEVALYLEFPFENIDSVLTAWKLLKTKFEAQSPLTLEQQLFYKASSLLEVPQADLTVQLYDTYNLRKEPLFMRAIYFADGRVQTEESNPKSETRKIQLTVRGVQSDAEAVLKLQGRYGKERVYNCILNFARSRFTQRACFGERPIIEILETEEHLRFEVVNLCKEVIPNDDGMIETVLRRLGLSKDWYKRELLTFLITHENTANGIRLTIDLDGKFGSSLYTRIRRSGYLPMETDFAEELENYADKIKENIRSALKTCGNE